MNKTLGHTKIEYGDRSWNFYPGCLHFRNPPICPVNVNCWAKKEAHQHKRDFEPHLIPELLLSPLRVKKPSTILVNFTGDMFGDWVNPDEVVEVETNKERGKQLFFLKQLVFSVIEARPEHRFLFLTKNPTGLLRWGQFPDNAWVGVSVCNQKMFNEARDILRLVKAKHKWLSIEPLLDEIVIPPPYDLEGINWTVIGAQSSPVLYPDVYWVENLVWACLDAHIPIWLKNNLVKCLPPAPPFYIDPLLPAKKGTEMLYRQELPK